uniref:Uncharacterized protein n=1 Tax=Clastoptera arizonana TaxID=38151 RepID=A0A1B6CJL9_9HEMI
MVLDKEVLEEVPLHDTGHDSNGDVGVKQEAYRYHGVYRKTTPQYIPGKGVSRYSHALRNLIPVRRKTKKKEKLGLDEAGFFSFITYSWMNRFMFKAYKKGFSFDDIPEPSSYDTCDYNAQRLEILWQEEMSKKGPCAASLGSVVWKFIRTRALIATFVLCMNNLIGFVSVVFFMRRLIEYAESSNVRTMDGVIWALCLGLTEVTRVICYATLWAVSFRTASRLRSACLAMLYRKVLRLHSLGDKSIGEIINMFANDGERIFNMIVFGPMVVSGPLSMTLGVLYILWLLSPWALIGMLVFIMFYPVQYGMSRLAGHFQAKVISIADQRIRLTAEILNCIKMIKMYAWEKSFTAALNDIRNKELKFIHRAMYCQSLTVSIASTVPIISAIVMFLSHLAGGYNLTASQAFTTICFCLKQLAMVMIFTADSWRFIIEGRISIRRFQSVMLLNEIGPFINKPMDKSQAVCIAGGKFAWDGVPPEHETAKNGKKSSPKIKNSNGDKKSKDLTLNVEETINLNSVEEPRENYILNDINFYAAKGSLIGICGQVGSGKSSLLSAALGQMRLIQGKVSREGQCAYVCQQAWILNATLKENILFGEAFNAIRYFNALHCCALNDDINLLPGGDETEIGERGITLSGGQKQRVALARALYADRDIYFLDDPLSAVDVHVGQHIFNKYIMEALKNKTVIFVTHQIQFLNRCDEICVIKDGQIVERGTYNNLLSKAGEFASMVNTWNNSQKESAVSPDMDSDEANSGGDQSVRKRNSVGDTRKSSIDSENLEGGKTLVEAEQVERGTINIDTYLSYIKAAGGFCVFFFVILIFTFNVGTTAFSSYWLARWIRAGSGNSTMQVNNVTVLSPNIGDNPDFNMYRIVYAMTIGVVLVGNLIRGFAFTKACLKASEKIHSSLFKKIMSAQMIFFETTPCGRIQNLFSKDTDEMDSHLPFTLENMLEDLFTLMYSFLFICIVFPYFILPLVLLSIIYYSISKIFRAAIRDIKRTENVSRSPIFSSVAATIHGLGTIHAFNKESDFISKFTSTFDKNTTCLLMSVAATRWLSLRIDLLSVTITSIVGLMITFFHGEVPPAFAGLAIAYSASISGIFQYVIRMISEAETRFISIERINMYLRDIKEEGGTGPKGKPPNNWPQNGSIRFTNVSLRYRPNLPTVLKDVSFKIHAGEKIGIVGRTGSGKSSLTVALFRLVELSGGSIKIDHLDISTLDLDMLRSKLSIIPQDPVLFAGTVRSNLDPFSNYSDEELWLSLEKTTMKEKVNSLEGQLDAKIGHSGDNLSVGERQLLCLSRALLRKSKILVLDEATAAIDPDTEVAVQKTIQEEFKDCTVITIAHRLVTVLNCDRVLVMEHGKVVEFDKPSTLMERRDSKLSQLVSAGRELRQHRSESPPV